MSKLAIIGGSGLREISGMLWRQGPVADTPYGRPSAEFTCSATGGLEVIFLPRHGRNHSLAPHLINYRANIAALHAVGVTHIIAVNAVGGLNEATPPGALVVPDQIIDYSYARESSFYDGVVDDLRHVDFTEPYSDLLRDTVLRAAVTEGIDCLDGGVYGCTQGPRLETAAEVRRCRRDGCDLLGMTGMPEAVLARELDMAYASLCLVVNWGAGLAPGPISMELIDQIAAAGAQRISRLLRAATGILQSGSSGR